MDEEEKKDWQETLDYALEIKSALNLESIDTALLMMIYQDLDRVRYNTSD